MNCNEWQCYKILHSGEGERGEDVLVMGVWTPENAAQKAAAYFDQLEIQREHTTASDYDGAMQWIEVETSDGPRRFVVACKVVRTYEAREASV